MNGNVSNLQSARKQSPLWCRVWGLWIACRSLEKVLGFVARKEGFLCSMAPALAEGICHLSGCSVSDGNLPKGGGRWGSGHMEEYRIISIKKPQDKRWLLSSLI